MQGFTSSTTEKLDRVAAENGWTRCQNQPGEVEYRRNSLHVSLFLSVTGVVIHASTNRRQSPTSGKAAWAIKQLKGKS